MIELTHLAVDLQCTKEIISPVDKIYKNVRSCTIFTRDIDAHISKISLDSRKRF